MNPERFQRIRDLFRAVVAAPEAERPALLETLAAEDRPLLERFSQVLTVMETSGGLDADVVHSLLLEASSTTRTRAVEDPALALPEMLGRYSILGKIGEGGMGQVWRAMDTSLDREVAIKLLPRRWTDDPERLRQFRSEARIVASLNHPNIVTIHAVDEVDGVLFIVLELVSGTSLRDTITSTGMPFSRLLDYAIPMADALAAAHAGGVTHRDLKPENVMVTANGRIKILDFGLAKRSPRTVGMKLSSETWEGSREGVFGTPPYMSPEQIRGDATGPASDVFSLGILFHEMAVGSRPFSGASTLEIVSSILRDTPPAPSSIRAGVPEAFDTLIAWCLEKDPPRRPGNAGPVLERLEELRRERERAALRNLAEPISSAGVDSAPAAPRNPTLAIIPFQDLSPQRDLGYLCGGIAEDIQTALARVEGLGVRVVSRIDRETMSPVEMARMLKVSTFIDGSVARNGDRVRVTVRLVDAESAAQIWSSRFDRGVEDTFGIQDAAARAVAERFEMRLDSGVAVPEINDLAAHETYLKGRFFWGKRYEGGLRRALVCFEEAIAQDAGLAEAHVGRADCFALLGHFGVLPPDMAYSRARVSSERALEINRNLAPAYATLGWIAAFHDWKWADAEALFDRSLDLDPHYATAAEWKGIFLMACRRTDEAIDSLRRAQRDDPLSLMIGSMLGWALDSRRRNDESIRVLENVLEMDPRFVFAHVLLVRALSLRKRHEEAVATAERGARLSGRDGLSLALLGYAYGAAGRKADADSVIAEIGQGSGGRYVSPFHVALVHIGAQRNDAAVGKLAASVDARESFFASLNDDRIFDGLRSMPRFRTLLGRMNLPAGRPA